MKDVGLREGGPLLTPAERGYQVAIPWPKELASTDVAACRFDLRCRESLCRYRTAPEPDKYLCSRVDPGEVDLRTVSVCTCGHTHTFFFSPFLTPLLPYLFH